MTYSSGDLDVDPNSQDILKHDRLPYMEYSLDTRRVPIKAGDYGSYKYQRGGSNIDGGLADCGIDYGTRTTPRNLPPPPYAGSTSGYGTSRVSLSTEYSEHLYEIPN